jgi:hypothetical protein
MGQLRSIPDSVRKITLPDNWVNKFDIKPDIPLTHLVFGEKFNHPSYHLPSTLIHFTFGSMFNQPRKHLPHSLTHLQFGELFNQELSDIPPRLSWLQIGHDESSKYH